MRAFRVLPLILVLALATLAACMPVQPSVAPAAPSAATAAVTATSAMSTRQPGAMPTSPAVATPAASPSASARAQDVLAGTRWRVVSFGPQGTPAPALAAATITLEFKAGSQAGGNGGCNSYGGSYQVQGNALTFSQIISTMMACADNQINQQEQRYLEALQAAGTFEVTGDRLTIWYDNRQGMLNFVAVTTTTPAAQAAIGTIATQAPTGVTPAVVLPAVTTAEPPERVEFIAGSNTTQRSSLLPSGVDLKQYALAANAGQTLIVVVTSDGVPLSLLIEGPTGARWVSQADTVNGDRATQTVTLPEAGDYRVTLAKADHSPSTNYQVTFALDTK